MPTTSMPESDLIYLDNASTSWPKPPCVIETMARFLATDAANPGRGGHRMALATQNMVRNTRHTLAQLFNVSDLNRIILTSGATQGLNQAIRGIIAAHEELHDGSNPPHVVITTLEHNSTNRPLNELERAGRITLTRIRFDPDSGQVDSKDIADAVKSETILVAFVHGSNVLGTVQPAKEIIEAVRQQAPEVITMMDVSQSAGHVPLDVEDLAVDLLVGTGHKGLLGPSGTGFFYVSPAIYDPESGVRRIVNIQSGGTGGDSREETQPAELPHYFESGTPNTIGIAGLGAGVQYVVEQGVGKACAHETQLAGRFVEQVGALERVHVFAADRGEGHLGNISFVIDGYDASDVAAILDETFNIAVRAGLHCAPYALRNLGQFPGGTVRMSPGLFTTNVEIDALISAIEELALG